MITERRGPLLGMAQCIRNCVGVDDHFGFGRLSTSRGHFGRCRFGVPRKLGGLVDVVGGFGDVFGFFSGFDGVGSYLGRFRSFRGDDGGGSGADCREGDGAGGNGGVFPVSGGGVADRGAAGGDIIMRPVTRLRQIV